MKTLFRIDSTNGWPICFHCPETVTFQLFFQSFNMGVRGGGRGDPCQALGYRRQHCPGSSVSTYLHTHVVNENTTKTHYAIVWFRWTAYIRKFALAVMAAVC